jgi:hypothetical protein
MHDYPVEQSYKRHRSAWLCVLCLLAAYSFVRGATPPTRTITFADVPRALHGWLIEQGVTPNNFNAHVTAINTQTAARERDGEYDHLIFFLLQSARFTKRPRIEPALSAYEFVQRLKPDEQASFLQADSSFTPSLAQMPSSARVRLTDFLKALRQETTDERLIYFKGLLPKLATSTLEAHLYTEYARAMRFLYRKEFAGRDLKPEQLAAYVAELYQQRAHSTDTQIEANFAVYSALAALQATAPTTRLNKVLIVGPGLDFAPRTDLLDLFEPQSYQPFAVADALLSLRLADPAQLQLHCVDINERVVAHLRDLPQRAAVTLSLLSGISDTAAHPLTQDYKDYFRRLGQSIGAETELKVPSSLHTHLRKSLRVRPEIAARISAHRLNIITARCEPSPAYDLVIVTNVFPYFKATELLLALTNISLMMRPSGYLIHNELQTVPSTFVAALGLPLVQARTVLLAANDQAPLFDGVALHRKDQR